MRTAINLLSVLVLFCFFAGCTRQDSTRELDKLRADNEALKKKQQDIESVVAALQPNPSSNEPKREKGVISITPFQLFQGNTTRLEPHLGLLGHGSFRVNCDDDIHTLSSTVAFWKDGKPGGTPVHGITTYTGKLSGEYSISLRNVLGGDGAKMIRVVTAGPLGNSSQDIDEKLLGGFPGPGGSGGRIRALTVKEGAATAVWAYVAANRPLTSGLGETLEDAAKRADKALVWSLTFNKAKK